MDTIAKLIPIMLKLSSNNEELCEKASFIAWKMVVGNSLVKVTAPKRLVKKTLIVAVLDETWRRELEQFSPQLLFQINTILGTTLVTGFEFYVDAKEITPKIFQQKNLTLKDIPVDPVILKSAQKIADDELRKKFIVTASKYLVAQETRKELQAKKDNLMK